MADIRFPDREQKNLIGFSFLMENLEIITPYGMEEKRNARPFKRDEIQLLLNELDNVEKAMEGLKGDKELYREVERNLRKIRDIRCTVRRCGGSDVLDEVELYEIKNFAMISDELLPLFDRMSLLARGFPFHSLEGLFSLLDPEKRGLATFHVYDEYSRELKDIRDRKRRIEDRIREENCKERIMKLKAERLEIVILEEAEEHSIRRRLTREIAEYALLMEDNMRAMGSIDFIIAKAKLASRFNGVRPEIGEDMEIVLDDIFNPEIGEMLERKGREFTLLSIALNKGVTAVTGANMGGKTVALKTIVLNLLLGQMGFFIFGRYGKFPILDFIYLISEDMQSVSGGLSSFGAEIFYLKDVLKSTREGAGFIALDEFARGTNPREGRCLVKSLCRLLAGVESISIIATHFDGVTGECTSHYQAVGLKNADFNRLKELMASGRKSSVEFIQDTMDYRLEKVPRESPVPRDAFNICALLGLDDKMLDIAKAYYDKDEDDNRYKSQ